VKATAHDELQGLHDENVRLRHELAVARAVNRSLGAAHPGSKKAHSLVAPGGETPENEAATPPKRRGNRLLLHHYGPLYAEFCESGQTLPKWCAEKLLKYPTFFAAFKRLKQCR
jgi:hypothetical protein